MTTNDRARDEILAMHAADQTLRVDMIAAIRRQDASEEWVALVAEAERLDEEHSKRVTALLREHGWLGPQQIGDEAAEALNHLLGHRVSADTLDVALPILRAAVDAGDASPVTLAEVEDRSNVARGRPQRHGTQWRRVDDGPFEPFPLDGTKTEVDARRAEAGIPSLDDFEKLVKDAYG